MRLLPDQLRVAITERTPVAFVRHGNTIGLVDEMFAEQFQRDDFGVAVIKAAGQFLHGGQDWRNSRFDRSQNVRKLYDRFGGQRSSVG